ncbi:MAG: 4Fe-4S dicluster domain-containing protein [Spirochaetes bacterium]|nr:4Fe-4S dicluster domain-containing protein [Spirochaetota bacterium]
MANPGITVSKDNVKNMLNGFLKQRTLFAPAMNGKKLDYLPVANVDDIVFDDNLPYKSPKEIFFPKCEKIITFKDGEAEAEISKEQFVLFGARPCDLEALEIMKKVFTQGKFKDPYFQERYDNTLLIGLGCKDKKPGCFCDERETDMGFCDKCDLFLEMKGESYEVAYVSEKGREAFKPYIKGIESFENTPRTFAPAKTLSIDTTEEDLFAKIEWENIVETCQGCGMCTYICPTCHCFGFKDVDEGGCASRYRNWDSCMFPKFTLHASGHNPREEKHDRYRQRIAHKYLYVKKNFGSVACTGCGRCLRACPAGVNIKTVAEEIMEGLK